MRTLYERLKSRETWERALFYWRLKTPGEVKESWNVKKKDVLPLTLSIIIPLLIILLLSYLPSIILVFTWPLMGVIGLAAAFLLKKIFVQKKKTSSENGQKQDVL